MTTAPVTSVTDELLADLEAAADYSANKVIRSHGWNGTADEFTDNMLGADEKYMRKADPATVLALLAERAELKRQLAEAVDGSGVMRLFVLIGDIRTACGDDGKRMQPELVEYIGELKRDAERLDFMDAPHPSRTIGSHDGCTLITISTTPGRTFSTARAAIDNAMEATK